MAGESSGCDQLAGDLRHAPRSVAKRRAESFAGAETLKGNLVEGRGRELWSFAYGGWLRIASSRAGFPRNLSTAAVDHAPQTARRTRRRDSIRAPHGACMSREVPSSM